MTDSEVEMQEHLLEKIVEACDANESCLIKTYSYFITELRAFEIKAKKRQINYSVDDRIEQLQSSYMKTIDYLRRSKK